MTISASSHNLMLIGDMALDQADYRAMLRHVAPLLNRATLSFANCEWALTDRREAAMSKSGLLLGSWPRQIEAFTYAGIDVVGLANNHVMNFGWPGLEQTIELLDAVGIAHCGGGRDRAAAHRPAIVETEAATFAFLAYTSVFSAETEATEERPGLAVVKITASYTAPARAEEMPGTPYQVKTVADARHVALMQTDIAAARRLADIVVVSWHWGVSGGLQMLMPYQRELAHLAVDAGADLVVGHHPHVIQGIELYRGKAIAYSLAQCGFDMVHPSLSDEAFILEAQIAGRAVAGHRVLPIGNANQCPEPLQGRAAQSCLHWLDRLSRPLDTTIVFDGDIGAPEAQPHQRDGT